jgi:hypothetical protein
MIAKTIAVETKVAVMKGVAIDTIAITVPSQKTILCAWGTPRSKSEAIAPTWAAAMGTSRTANQKT